MQKNGGTFTLGYDRLTFSETTIFDSTDLSNWINRASFTIMPRPRLAIWTSLRLPRARPTFTECRAWTTPRLRPICFSQPPLVAKRSLSRATFRLSPKSFSTPRAMVGLGPTKARPAERSKWWNTQVCSILIPRCLFMEWNSTATYGGDLRFLYSLNYTSAHGGTFTGLSNAGGYDTLTGTFTSSP